MSLQTYQLRMSSNQVEHVINILCLKNLTANWACSLVFFHLFMHACKILVIYTNWHRLSRWYNCTSHYAWHSMSYRGGREGGREEERERVMTLDFCARSVCAPVSLQQVLGRLNTMGVHPTSLGVMN